VKFIKNMIKFPSNLGYTGNSFINDEILEYNINNPHGQSKVKKHTIDFKEDLDNHV